MISKILNSWPKRIAVGLALAALAGLAFRSFPAGHGDSAAGKPIIAPTNLSAKAQAGKSAFDANCAPCHGLNGAGTDKGPPFVHIIYNPGHHPDEAFFYAAAYGVRSHHWNFGDMPAQKQVSESDVAAIIAYVRALQEANGIFYQPHRM